MIPLTVLLAAPLLINVADDKVGCKHYKPFNTLTNVKVHVLENLYEYEVPRKQLTHSREKATKAWQDKQSDQVWATGDLTVEGLAGGATWTTSEAAIIGKPYDWYGQYYCPFIQSLDINIYYNTMIFVAKEKKKGTCEFNATLEHENLHHEANVVALNEAVEKLKADLPQIIAYMEERYVPRSEVENSFDTLHEGIGDAIRVYGKYAADRMSALNSQIDVPEEYERVANKCPR
jgi:hypothetical protein